VNQHGAEVFRYQFEAAPALVGNVLHFGIEGTVSGEQFVGGTNPWRSFSTSFSASLTREQALARYGRTVRVKISDARSSGDHPGFVFFIDWNDGEADALVQHLIDTHPFSTSPHHRNLVWNVTSRPAVRVIRWFIFETDHPNGWPDNNTFPLIIIPRNGFPANLTHLDIFI